MNSVKKINDEKVDSIIQIIKNASNNGIIDKSYISLAEKLIEDLYEIDNELFNKGKVNSWACGIIHTLALLNGLFDKKREKYIMVSELYKSFEVSSSTGLSKSKYIRNLIDITNNKYILNKTNKEYDIKEENIIEIKIDENIKKANELCNVAWKERNFNKRIKLAKDALMISEKCSEAYIILSYDNSISNNKKKEYALKAIEFSENIIGKDNINKYKKEFLKEEITRTYYSSKYRLGNLLWENGEGNEAIDVFLELINIYPEDSTLIRLTLMSWMIIEKRFEELEKLFENYKEDFLAGTKYSKALYYLIKGEEDKALRNLRIANSNNPYIMEHLLKIKKVNMKEIEFNSLGSEGEAINYLRFGEQAWNSFKNSKKWLKEVKNNL